MKMEDVFTVRLSAPSSLCHDEKEICVWDWNIVNLITTNGYKFYSSPSSPRVSSIRRVSCKTHLNSQLFLRSPIRYCSHYSVPCGTWKRWRQFAVYYAKYKWPGINIKYYESFWGASKSRKWRIAAEVAYNRMLKEDGFVLPLLHSPISR